MMQREIIADQITFSRPPVLLGRSPNFEIEYKAVSKYKTIKGYGRFFQGRRYPLRVVGITVRLKVIVNKSRLEPHVRSGTSVEQRERHHNDIFRALMT